MEKLKAGIGIEPDWENYEITAKYAIILSKFWTKQSFIAYVFQIKMSFEISDVPLESTYLKK